MLTPGQWFSGIVLATIFATAILRVTKAVVR